MEADFQETLTASESDNRQLLASAEDTLFSTFTKELAENVQLSPQYVAQKADEINGTLWELVKYFFTCYNAENTDCHFVIDDAAKTVTAAEYTFLPTLFYYWNGKQNAKYRSQKKYGMATDFKPRYGRIRLVSWTCIILYCLRSDAGLMSAPCWWA